MKELSLNIIDIVENSVKAGALLTQIIINETKDCLELSIIDDGCGMSNDVIESVVNPFYTTRTTRSVGLGVPFLKIKAEQTGGSIVITSKVKNDDTDEHGTEIKATFYKNHLDFTPLGDVISSIITIIQGHHDRDFLFIHRIEENEISLDTRELRRILEGVCLAEYEVLQWIKEYLDEQYSTIIK